MMICKKLVQLLSRQMVKSKKNASKKCSRPQWPSQMKRKSYSTNLNSCSNNFRGLICSNGCDFSPDTSTSSNLTFFLRRHQNASSGKATWTKRWKTCVTCFSMTIGSKSWSWGSIRGLFRAKKPETLSTTSGPTVKATSLDLSSAGVSKSRSICVQRCRNSP